MDSRKLTGAWGEATAAAYLRKHRYAIVDCNYTSRLGEIDLVATNRRYIVFVEVKLRADDSHGAAREFVTPEKQRKIKQTAMLYLSTHDTQLQPRFDVIEIYAPDGIQTKRPKINHWSDAF